MKYVCLNEECEKYGIEEYYSSESFKYKDGRLVGEHSRCPVCGKERQEINPNKDVPLSEKNINVSVFNSLSTEQKREALKKRSHDHFQKTVKERKDGLLNQAVTEMKDIRKGK